MQGGRELIEKVGAEFIGRMVMGFAGDRASEVLDKTVETALQAYDWANKNPESSQWEPLLLNKAVTSTELIETNLEPKGKKYDPYGLFLTVGIGGEQGGGEYREYPNKLTFDTVRAMFMSTSVLSAIVQTRINQVACFARPPRDKYSTGFIIEPRSRHSSKRIGKREKDRIEELEKFIDYTGITRAPARRDNFEAFLRKFCRDSLMFDQAVARITPQANRGDFIPAEFDAMDGSTFRIAQIRNKDGEVEDNGYVQVIDGRIMAFFEPHEVVWGIRNPRTDVRTTGYGVAEAEMLINVISAILFSEEYNRRVFQTGSTPKGMIFIKTPPGHQGNSQLFTEQLANFRRQFMAQVTGVHNSWKTPVLSGPELQWVDLENKNRDMEWSNYHDLLVKLTCSVFQIDPAEIGFDVRSMSSSPASISATSAEYAVRYSKDKGLTPFLRFIEDNINQNLIWAIDDNFVFRFVGLDSKEEREVIDLKTKEVQWYKTVNEVRKELDLPPIDGGDIILNGVFTAAIQAEQAAQQEAMMGGEGQPGMMGGDAGEQAPAEANVDMEGDNPAEAMQGPDASFDPDADQGQTEKMAKSLVTSRKVRRVRVKKKKEK